MSLIHNAKYFTKEEILERARKYEFPNPLAVEIFLWDCCPKSFKFIPTKSYSGYLIWSSKDYCITSSTQCTQFSSSML